MKLDWQIKPNEALAWAPELGRKLGTVDIGHCPPEIELSPDFANEMLNAFLDIGRPLTEEETLALYKNLGYPK